MLFGTERIFIVPYPNLIETYAKLHKMNVEFNWTHRQTIAFETLKNTRTKSIDENLWTIIEVTLTTDASEHAVVVILSQEGHPVINLLKNNGSRNKLCEYWKEATSNSMQHGKGTKPLIRTEILLKSDWKPFKSQKRIAKDYAIENFWNKQLNLWHLILHADVISRPEFDNEKLENHENAEDKIRQWLQTNVLP